MAKKTTPLRIAIGLGMWSVLIFIGCTVMFSSEPEPHLDRETATPEEIVRHHVNWHFRGKLSGTDLDKLDIYFYDDESLTVRFLGGSNISASAARTLALVDMVQFLKRVSEDASFPHPEQYRFTVLGAMRDQYGNVEPRVVMNAKIPSSEVRKVNFERFDYKDLERLLNAKGSLHSRL